MKTHCDTCNRTFKDDSTLYTHTLRECKTCMYCTFRFDDVEDIREHMNDNHMEVSCSICKRKYFHQGGLDTHMYNYHNPDGIKRGGGYRRRRRGRSNPPTSKFVIEIEKFDSVERFLEDMVQPDQSLLERYREIIDRLKLFLQQETEYSVSGVFKGGSFGKGTTIRAKSDIDMVVFLNNYSSVAEIQKNMEKVTKELMRCIQHDDYWKMVATDMEQKEHAVEFSLKCEKGDTKHDVDLLPAVDVLPKGGTKTQEEIWTQMKGETSDVRSYYSVSFFPKQVDFVKECPSRVKDLIRLVKHWKTIEKVKIRSYCIELVVIHLWRKWGEPDRMDMKKRLCDIFQQLSSMSTTSITWPDVYDITKFSTKPRGSCVMDPANPFMNTAPTAAQAKEVEKNARIVYQHLSAR